MNSKKTLDFVSLVRNTLENDLFIEKYLHKNNHVLIIKSSLYVLEDTQLILSLYKKGEIAIKSQSSNLLEEKAKNYLLIYGILQTLFIQQDAIINICASLNIFSKKIIHNNSELSYIRGIRNSSTGHPSNTRKDSSINFVSQTSVSQYYFNFLKVKQNKSEVIKVNIKDLIQMQEKNCDVILGKIMFKIEEMIYECNNS